MSAVFRIAASQLPSPSVRWLPVLLGLVVLYAPTIYYLNATHWDEEEHAHGPLILLTVAWIFWRQRAALLASEDHPATVSGIAVLLFGLVCYVLGRSQSVIALEVGSIIPVMAGALLLIKGWRCLFALSFPLIFLAFMVPLPGFILIPLTSPLREYVSMIAEAAVRALDYPIARSGVILNVGPYQLLVANACSGINSMFALMALGALYLHLMSYRSAWRNGILLASILPIAFAANIVRVITLVVVTYHFGEAAGQGVIHGLSGIGLFIVALVMLLVLDATLGATAFRRSNVT